MTGQDDSRDHALAIWFACLLVFLLLPVLIVVTR